MALQVEDHFTERQIEKMVAYSDWKGIPLDNVIFSIQEDMKDGRDFNWAFGLKKNSEDKNSKIAKIIKLEKEVSYWKDSFEKEKQQRIMTVGTYSKQNRKLKEEIDQLKWEARM